MTQVQPKVWTTNYSQWACLPRRSRDTEWWGWWRNYLNKKFFEEKKNSNEPFFYYYFIITRHDLKSFGDLNLNNLKIITANIWRFPVSKQDKTRNNDTELQTREKKNFPKNCEFLEYLCQFASHSRQIIQHFRIRHYQCHDRRNGSIKHVKVHFQEKLLTETFMDLGSG